MTKQEKYYHYIISDMIKNTPFWFYDDGTVKIEFPMYGDDSGMEFEFNYIEIKKWSDKGWEGVSDGDKDYLTQRYGVKGDETEFVINLYSKLLAGTILASGNFAHI